MLVKNEQGGGDIKWWQKHGVYVYLERKVLLRYPKYVFLCMQKLLLLMKPNNYESLICCFFCGIFLSPSWPIFLVVGSSFDQCDWLSPCLSLSIYLVFFLKKLIKKTLQTIPAEDECCRKERKGKGLIESWIFEKKQTKKSWSKPKEKKSKQTKSKIFFLFLLALY